MELASPLRTWITPDLHSSIWQSAGRCEVLSLGELQAHRQTERGFGHGRLRAGSPMAEGFQGKLPEEKQGVARGGH